MSDDPTPPPLGESGLLRAEQDIQRKLGDSPLDFESMQAIANIYRAAAGVRRVAERTVLAEQGLSWGGFAILYVLWVWDEMETSKLAAECDLAKGTLTGMVSTLEKQELVKRRRLDHDKRRVTVALTPAGTQVIEQIFPHFNDFEAKMTVRLPNREKATLSQLLRVVIGNAGEA